MPGLDNILEDISQSKAANYLKQLLRLSPKDVALPGDGMAQPTGTSLGGAQPYMTGPQTSQTYMTGPSAPSISAAPKGIPPDFPSGPFSVGNPPPSQYQQMKGYKADMNELARRAETGEQLPDEDAKALFDSRMNELTMSAQMAAPLQFQSAIPPVYRGGMEAGIKTASTRTAAKAPKLMENYQEAVTTKENFHANPRIVLKDKKGSVVVGPPKPADIVKLVNENLSESQIHESAAWFPDTVAQFKENYGEENYEPYMMAWLLTQAGESPSDGVHNTLVAERRALGLPEETQAGTAGKVLGSIMKGEAPAQGAARKISDLGDNLIGKTTRTIMGDDPSAGTPEAIDRHMYRAAGYVDPGLISALQARFGEGATVGIKLDSQVTGQVPDSHYEPAAAFVRSLLAAFNKAKVAGRSDWASNEVMPVVWTAYRQALGLPTESPGDMFTRNYSTIPLELAWGTNSPAAKTFPDISSLPYKQNRDITNQVLNSALEHFAPALGVRVVKSPMKTGVYKGDMNPSKQVEVLGTDHAVQDLTDVMSFFANQTEGIAYKLKYNVSAADRASMEPSESRSVVSASAADVTGIDIYHAQFKDRAFLKRFSMRLAAIDPRFSGSTLSDVDGKPTLRILNTEPKIVFRPNDPNADSAGYVRGKWTTQEFKDMEGVLNNVAQEFKLDDNSITTDWLGATLLKTKNDWGKYSDGSSHLERMVKEGRQAYIKQVVSDTRTLLPKWTEAAFKKYAPDIWDGHFGEKGFDPAIWNSAWIRPERAVTPVEDLASPAKSQPSLFK